MSSMRVFQDRIGKPGKKLYNGAYILEQTETRRWKMDDQTVAFESVVLCFIPDNPNTPFVTWVRWISYNNKDRPADSPFIEDVAWGNYKSDLDEAHADYEQRFLERLDRNNRKSKAEPETPEGS